MRGPVRGLLHAIATRPPVRVAALAVYFFTGELGSYFAGVLACTLLVKRAGAGCLPTIYLTLNAVFLPITLSVILKPPRSGSWMLRMVLAGYLACLALLIPITGSESAFGLGLTFVVARLGKLLVGTFEAGMLAEVLPLREVKQLVPRLAACDTLGIVTGGLLMNPALALFGTRGTFVMLWGFVAASFATMLLLQAALPPAVPTDPPPRSEKGLFGTVISAFGEVWMSPLPRLIGGIGFFTVAARYLVEYSFAAAQARHFASEKAMAAFAGNFEAGLSTTAVLVQLALAVPLMRALKMGGVALLMPASLVLSLSAALLAPGFYAIASCQFLYWLCYDCFSGPVRQVMMGAVPPAQLSRVPVLITVTNILGSFVASVLLFPLARIESPRPALAAALVVCGAFLVLALRAGSTYLSTLTRTLEELDAEGRRHVLGALASGEEGPAAVSTLELLSSPDPGLRRSAALQAGKLRGDVGAERLAERLAVETDPAVKSVLISTLGLWRPRGLHAAVLALLDDPDARVRANALEALASWGEVPGVAEAVAARLTGGTPRERAAAILATVRLAATREALAAALDQLAALARGDEAERAAAAAAMGRAGYGCFVPDLIRLLSDAAPAVRGAALDAVAASHVADAATAIAAARDRETEPELRARMEAALARLSDETRRSIVDVLDHLSADERAHVRRALTSSREDSRTRIVRAALDLPHPGLRAELVRLAQALEDPELLAVLERCVTTAEGTPRVDLAPLLEHLGARPGREAGYDALRRLLGPDVHGGVAAHVAAAALKLWTYTAIEEAAGAASDAKLCAVRDRAAERRKLLLDHILAVTGAAAPSPEQAQRVMRAALSENRYLSSISLELLEEWLPKGIREPVIGILEFYPDAASRRTRAAELSGLSPGSPEKLLETAAQEGL